MRVEAVRTAFARLWGDFCAGLPPAGDRENDLRDMARGVPPRGRQLKHLPFALRRARSGNG